MLDHLRVLDLCDERGLMAGRILADLGADVVLVEPQQGSTARGATPVAADGTSMAWQAWAANRRGVTLDQLPALLPAADVLITSARPSELEALGLGDVRDRFPHLVHTSVTGFGLDGPKAEWADSDLVVWAAGGPLEPHRDTDFDRAPLRISVPQAWLHAGADAAAGTLVALRARARTGRGQLVDVSAQEAVGAATLARVLADPVGDANPEFQQTQVKRTDQSGSGAATPNRYKKWQVLDGMVELHLSMGPAAGAFTNNLFGWLRDEGALSDEVASWDWRTMPEKLASGELGATHLDNARAQVRSFLAGKTKQQVVDAALQRRLLSMAIYDIADLLASPQAAAREFFTSVSVNGREATLPGRFAHLGEGERIPGLRRRAPDVGEHSAEVLAEWATNTSAEGAPTPGEVRAQVSRDTTTEKDAPSTAPDALAGLRVVDLSWVVAGPLIGRALADFGAQVIRIESGTRIETARLMQPFHGGVAGPDNSALFGNCNAGKLGLTLDLKSSEGQDLVRQLVADADVVVESFSPGQMDRWGLGFEALRAVNPRLVMMSTSIAGQSGPWAKLAGFGNVGSALSGFQNLVGHPDGLPLGPFGPYTDYVGPRFGLAALLAALARRDRTGQGAHLDVAQLEAGVFFLSPQVLHASYEGVVAQRRGNTDEAFAPHGVFRAAAEEGRERFVAVALTHDAQWPLLAGVIGRRDLAARRDLRTAAGRRKAAAELDQAIEAWTSTLTAGAAEAYLQAVGVPAHQVVGTADYAADPQLTHRGHLVELPSQRHGTTFVQGPRYRLSDTPGQVRREAPHLGRDTTHVLTEILGLEAATVDALTQKGVLR